jgi:hypothetical protein
LKTAAKCRAVAGIMREEIAALRSQTTADIAIIRAAVQEIDRAVAKIKGFLGVNGDTPHLHGRKADADEAKPHLHQRRSGDGQGDWRVNVMWKAGIWLLTAMLAPILFAVGTALAKRLIP